MFSDVQQIGFVHLPKVACCLFQVLQCVAMNVTLIYSLLAYSSIRQRDFSGVYVSLSSVYIT